MLLKVTEGNLFQEHFQRYPACSLWTLFSPQRINLWPLSSHVAASAPVTLGAAAAGVSMLFLPPLASASSPPERGLHSIDLGTGRACGPGACTAQRSGGA